MPINKFFQKELKASKNFENQVADWIQQNHTFQEWAGVKTAGKAARRIVRSAGDLRPGGRCALVKWEDYEISGDPEEGFETHHGEVRVAFVDMFGPGDRESAMEGLRRLAQGVLCDIPCESHFDEPVTEPLEAEGENGHGVSVLRCVVFHDDWVPAVSSFVGGNSVS